LVEQLHTEFHALHDTSWHLGVGKQHTAVEDMFHLRRYGSVMADNADPSKLVAAVIDLRTAVAKLASAAK